MAGAVGGCARTVRKWVARYRAEGADGLLDRSLRPHRQPRALPPTVAALVVALRPAPLEWSPESPPRCKCLPPPSIGSSAARDSSGWPPSTRRRTSPSAGWEYVHVCVDDHSRVAFSQGLPRRDARRYTRGNCCTDRLNLHLLPAFRHPCPPRADRQRWVLPLPSLQRTLCAGRPPPSLHPPLHAPDQREGRTLHPDRTARVGLCPRRQHLRPAHRASRALAAPLQLAPATRQSQGQATHQPNRADRGQPVEVPQLAAGFSPRRPPLDIGPRGRHHASVGFCRKVRPEISSRKEVLP